LDRALKKDPSNSDRSPTPHFPDKEETDMSQSIMKFFGIVFLTALLFAGAEAANAFEITQGIPNTNQTACMDVAGNNANSGTAVQAFPCTGGFNEQWSFVAGNLEGLGTTASGANCANPVAGETVVVLSGCWAPPEVGWNIFQNGSVEFFNQATCMDSQSQYGSGAQIALVSPCTGAPSEAWVVRDLVLTQKIPNSNQYACADVQGQAIANNTPVNAYPCTFGANERWTYINGQLQGIGTSKSQSTCLGTATSGNVIKVVLQTCSLGNQSQQWILTQGWDSNGNYGDHIQNAQEVNGYLTGPCLDSQGKYGNAQLVLTKCDLQGPTSALWIVR
jgi:hypothetical protein